MVEILIISRLFCTYFLPFSIKKLRNNTLLVVFCIFLSGLTHFYCNNFIFQPA